MPLRLNAGMCSGIFSPEIGKIINTQPDNKLSNDKKGERKVAMVLKTCGVSQRAMSNLALHKLTAEENLHL
jgi:hypothetical protein